MKKIAPYLVILAAVLWGVMGIFVRRLETMGLGTMEIVAIRVAATAIVMMGFLMFYDRSLLKIKPRDLWLFLFNGLVSVMLFNFSYYKTMSLTSLSVAAVLLYTAPIMVMMMSAIIFKERINAQKLAALGLAFGGCVFVTGVLGNASSISALGLGTGLLAGFGYALYSIFGTLIMKRNYHPLTVTAYTFFIASFVVVPMSDLQAIGEVASMGGGMLLYLLAFALVSSILPFSLYTVGLSHMETSKASIIASVEPVVATIVGVLVFHEAITVAGIFGICLVLSAVVLLNMKVHLPHRTAKRQMAAMAKQHI
ncbi:MAG: DMT family transporter [Bacillota bacterium]|nr:DMT family transporter [Bacillota bacterium]